MARSGVYFPLILSTLLLLLFGAVFAVNSRESTDAPLKLQYCNFDEKIRAYNVTDLLLCMNEQARNILFQQSTNPNRITDRAYQDTRQSYPAYPFASAYSIPPTSASVALSNYFGNQMLSQLFSGGFALPNLSNFLDFSSFTRPGFNFFNALSSIAQYDDLKCVSRILCEVASGSMPGSLTYRQNFGFENFGGNFLSGSNALFGLLTAFDTSGTSPILSFGKAALLGYTNRGQPHICYREYSRCPRDSGQLIAYLNNHNGGFFRFFSGIGGAYYPQQQYGYRPQNYYKNSDESEYRIIQKPLYTTSQIFSEVDVDQGGSEVFDNADYYNRDINKPDFFTMKIKESTSSKLVFPENREDRFKLNYFNGPFNLLDNIKINNFQKESLRKDRRFFSLADDIEVVDHHNDNPNTSNQIHDNRRPQIKHFENTVNRVRFPRETKQKQLPLLFPNNNKKQ